MWFRKEAQWRYHEAIFLRSFFMILWHFSFFVIFNSFVENATPVIGYPGYKMPCKHLWHRLTNWKNRTRKQKKRNSKKNEKLHVQKSISFPRKGIKWTTQRRHVIWSSNLVSSSHAVLTWMGREKKSDSIGFAISKECDKSHVCDYGRN